MRDFNQTSSQIVQRTSRVFNMLNICPKVAFKSVVSFWRAWISSRQLAQDDEEPKLVLMAEGEGLPPAPVAESKEIYKY